MTAQDNALSPIAVSEALGRAKSKHFHDGRGTAYRELMREFHQLVLPVFLTEAGSLTCASEMLGISRATLSKHLHRANISTAKKSGGVL